MGKKYYYSIEEYEFPELIAFLEDCDRRYKNLDLKIASNFTTAWMISNKDLYVPFEKSTMSYKRRELRARPTPERRWNLKWGDYKTKLARLKEIYTKVSDRGDDPELKGCQPIKVS